MRMRGHAEHDDMKYVPQEMLEEWAKKDPIARYERRLRRAAATPPRRARGRRRRASTRSSRRTWRGRRTAPCPTPRPSSPTCTATATSPTPLPPLVAGVGAAEAALMPVLTYLEAIRQAMLEEMDRDGRVFVIGEDVGTYGGAFRVTAGFLERFGETRVIDTPISESAIVGAAIGAALMGMRPIAEMQFIDFISCGFDQIVNYAAKSRYRWGGGVPMVIRGPCGGGVHGGPFHSQNPESFFMNVPGLKIVAPGTPVGRQGADDGGHPRPRPRDLPRAQVPLPPAQGGRARRASTWCRSARRGSRAAARTSRSSPTRRCCRWRWRPRRPRPADGIVVEVRGPAHAPAPRRGGDPRHGGEDGQGDRAARGHAHRRAGRRDLGPRSPSGPSSTSTRRSSAWRPPDTPVPYSPPLEEFFLPNAEKVGKAIRALL